MEEYILEGSTGKKWTVNDFFRDNEEGNQAKEEFLRRGKSFLPIFPLGFSRIHFFNHFRLYKIDQVEAKSPVKNYDDSELSYKNRISHRKKSDFLEKSDFSPRRKIRSNDVLTAYLKKKQKEKII